MKIKFKRYFILKKELPTPIFGLAILLEASSLWVWVSPTRSSTLYGKLFNKLLKKVNLSTSLITSI